MSASADTFTRDKLAWLDQVRFDHSLRPTCLHVAFAIASYVNRESGEAWPGHKRLADDTGLSVEAIKIAIRALKTAGHLIVQAGQGRTVTSRYRWHLSPREKGYAHTPIENETRTEKGVRGDPFKEEKGYGSPEKRGTHVPTNTMIKTFEDIGADAPISPSGSEREFENAAGKIAPFIRPVEDPAKRELFSAGLTMLAAITGKSHDECRKIIGRAMKQAGDKPALVMDAIKSARDGGKADPVSYLMAIVSPIADDQLPEEICEGFAEFERCYPPHSGHNSDMARKAFRDAVREGVPIAELVAAAKDYAAHVRKTGTPVGKVKRAANWLRDGEYKTEWSPKVQSATTVIPPEKWKKFCETFTRTGFWPTALGPTPKEPGFRGPAEMIQRRAVSA